MKEPAAWYSDPRSLLHKVKETPVHWGHVPDIEGYDRLAEERRGGQGIVYRGHQKSTNRTVAIKVLLDGMYASEADRLRFQREVAVVARLRHPNIVRVHESGTTPDGRLFYVMEWVEGKPLNDPGLDHAGDIGRTSALFARICDAVHFAHQRGVIHRDLKPSNILIGANGEPRILDFGLAKIASDSPESETTALSQTGQFLGSIAWASPEQVDSAPDRIDVRTDVYALGVILYQLLTGRLPHPVSSNLRRTLNDITSAPPPNPRSVRRDIPIDLETIVLRCLAKDPERRYQTAGDLADDIRRFLVGDPIDARRDNKGYMLRKLLVRHKAITLLGTALVLSVLGFALTMTILYRRAVDAEESARANLEEATTQAEKADAVRRFLNRMLSSVDPGRDGRDVRMIEILERAAADIDSGLKDQPEVEAELRMTIGLSYRALGVLQTAAVHLERAFELRKARLGEEHRETLISLNELAVLQVMQGKLTEAEALLERALEAGQRLYGERDALVLFTLSSLAALRNTQGRLVEAERLMRQLLDAHVKKLGEKHPDTIRTIHNLALVLSRADKKHESMLYCRQALELHKEVHGPDHVHTVRTKGNLGTLLMELGDLAEAEPLLLEALEGNRQLLGNEHPETISGLHNVAVLRTHQGRDAEALSLARKALAAAETALPRGHLMIARYRNHVGTCLTELGRYAEAERELLDAHQWMRGHLGHVHPYTQKTVAGLVELYESWQKPAEAEKWRARQDGTGTGASNSGRR